MKTIKNILVLGLSTLLIASCGGKSSNGAVTNTSSQDTGSTADYGTFPFAAINEFVSSTGVAVPGIVSMAEWEHGESSDENGPYYFATTSDDDTTLEVENAYLAAVKAVEWVCENDSTYTYDEYGYIYCDPTESVEIQFYTYQGYFNLYVTDLTYEYVSDVEGFDFTSESQITSSSGTSVTWTYEDITMTVDSSKASVTVGNGGAYLSNPLRLYASQTVTFTWTGTNPSAFVVNMNLESSKSTIAAGSDTSTGFSITGGTVQTSDTEIRYIPTGSSKTLTVTIGSKQCHWNYITVE